jgi:hypothetical protein
MANLESVSERSNKAKKVPVSNKEDKCEFETKGLPSR